MIRLYQLVGTPVPQPERTLAPLDPSWAALQRYLLSLAEQEGDQDRIAFFRRNLRLEATP